MKRRVSALVMLLILVLTMSTQAVEPRDKNGPYLSFAGTTAYCSAECKGSSNSDTVSATMTLYQGNNYVDSWSNSGKKQIALSGQCTVQSGYRYTLKLTYSINGKTQPSASVSGTCP